MGEANVQYNKCWENGNSDGNYSNNGDNGSSNNNDSNYDGDDNNYNIIMIVIYLPLCQSLGCCYYYNYGHYVIMVIT